MREVFVPNVKTEGKNSDTDMPVDKLIAEISAVVSAEGADSKTRDKAL